MSITWTNWRDIPLGTPYDRCSPNLNIIEDYLLHVAGGRPLGCYGVRLNRDGSAQSTHSWGAAKDWRYGNVGAGYAEVGRDAFLAHVLPWLIGNADALGIQQLHNYRDASIWRTGRGWKPNTGTGMGEAWAEYIHIETNVWSWGDTRPVASRGILALDMTPEPPNPPFDPEAPPMRTLTIDVPVLRLGHTGRDVLRLQALIWNLFGQHHVPMSSVFDEATLAGVRNVQTWMRLTVDGIVGPQTWTALLVSAQ
jgi:hypothetical protein